MTFARFFAVLVGVAFSLGALVHLHALLTGRTGDGSTPLRHAVFLGINLFFAVAFLRRETWLVAPTILFALQQTKSHGSQFLEAQRQGRVDWASVAVFVFLPLVVASAILLRQASDSTTSR